MHIKKVMILKYPKYIALLLLGVSPLVNAQQSTGAYTEEFQGTGLSLEFREIPAGSFSMGSQENETGRKEDEGPQMEVDVDAFWMSSTEITWGLYNLFLQQTSFDTPKGTEVKIDVDATSGATTPYVDMSLGMGAADYQPVGNVTWLAATRFTKWLSAVTGNYYRLPTEAEWEYAARAGSKDAYSFGNDTENIDSYAWYAGNSDETYHPVGQKEPNDFGLYDMHGNVAEWTLNQYDENGYQDGLLPITKEYPVSIRGGSFRDEAIGVRSASRQGSQATWKTRDPQFPKSKWWFTDAPFIGFRVVRPKEVPENINQYWPEDAK